MAYEDQVREREARLAAKRRGVQVSLLANVCAGALLGVPLKGQSDDQITEIAPGAWIGPNAVIMAGCNIGENAIVMPGAVVLEPVPPHAVVQGNPADLVDFACECGQPLNVINTYVMRVETLTGWRWHVPSHVEGAQAPCSRCGKSWDVKELVSREEV